MGTSIEVEAVRDYNAINLTFITWARIAEPCVRNLLLLKYFVIYSLKQKMDEAGQYRLSDAMVKALETLGVRDDYVFITTHVEHLELLEGCQAQHRRGDPVSF